ncbi:MAG: hypothetical protein ACRCV3_01315 [Desulfovibrionaceae bacterium]
MNTLLQIRVMAYTPDPSIIEKMLPKLLDKLYPNKNFYSSPPTIPRIIDDLSNLTIHLNKEEEKTLHIPINRVVTLHKELEISLSNWEPSKATTIAISLEESLLELEKTLNTAHKE